STGPVGGLCSVPAPSDLANQPFAGSKLQRAKCNHSQVACHEEVDAQSSTQDRKSIDRQIYGVAVGVPPVAAPPLPAAAPLATGTRHPGVFPAGRPLAGAPENCCA